MTRWPAATSACRRRARSGCAGRRARARPVRRRGAHAVEDDRRSTSSSKVCSSAPTRSPSGGTAVAARRLVEAGDDSCHALAPSRVCDCRPRWLRQPLRGSDRAAGPRRAPTCTRSARCACSATSIGTRWCAVLLDRRALECLADPPRGVGREPEAPPPVELVDGPHQAEGALLYEVGEVYAPVLVAPRPVDHQAQVGRDHLAAAPRRRLRLLAWPVRPAPRDPAGGTGRGRRGTAGCRLGACRVRHRSSSSWYCCDRITPLCARHSTVRTTRGSGRTPARRAGLHPPRSPWSAGAMAPGDASAEVAGPGGGARLVVVRHGATDWSRSGRHTGRTDLACSPRVDQAQELGRRWPGTPSPWCSRAPCVGPARPACWRVRGSRPGVRRPARNGTTGPTRDGRPTRSGPQRPGWSLWRDGVPGGETLSEVAARADRVVALVRAGPGDVLVFAHAHILRWWPPGGWSSAAAGRCSRWARPASASSVGTRDAGRDAVEQRRAVTRSPERPGSAGRVSAAGAAGRVAPRPADHVGQREGVEVAAHVLADVGPDRRAGCTGPCARRPRSRGVARSPRPRWGRPRRCTICPRVMSRAAGRARSHRPRPAWNGPAGAFEGQEDLLQVRLGEARALGDVAYRGRAQGVAVQRQRQRARLA